MLSSVVVVGSYSGVQYKMVIVELERDPKELVVVVHTYLLNTIYHSFPADSVLSYSP